MQNTINGATYVTNEYFPHLRADFNGNIQELIDGIWIDTPIYTAPSGYKICKIDGVRYLLHRVLACIHLGLDLHSALVVHHVDGDRENNSLSNLMICTIPEHAKIHHHPHRHTHMILADEIDDILSLREAGMGYDKLRNRFMIAKPTIKNLICDNRTLIPIISL